MKKIMLLSLIQGSVIFLIVGLMASFFKGDFFYQFLAPIAGLGAGAFRMLTAYLMTMFEKLARKKSDKIEY